MIEIFTKENRSSGNIYNKLEDKCMGRENNWKTQNYIEKFISSLIIGDKNLNFMIYIMK